MTSSAAYGVVDLCVCVVYIYELILASQRTRALL